MRLIWNCLVFCIIFVSAVPSLVSASTSYEHKQRQQIRCDLADYSKSSGNNWNRPTKTWTFELEVLPAKGVINFFSEHAGELPENIIELVEFDYYSMEFETKSLKITVRRDGVKSNKVDGKLYYRNSKGDWEGPVLGQCTKSGRAFDGETFIRSVREARITKNINDRAKNPVIAKNESNEKNDLKPSQNTRVILKNNQSTQMAGHCASLSLKMSKHIEDEEYDKASKVGELLKSLKCDLNSSVVSSSAQVEAKSAYTDSQLNCNVGPLGSSLFGDYGLYSVVSIDSSPPKDCQTTYEYCKSRSRAIADGANIKPSERTKTKSYSANCNAFGSNIDCSVQSYNNTGGFVGGLADGLSKGIEVASAKRRIYKSNFEVCMLDMGYRATEK